MTENEDFDSEYFDTVSLFGKEIFGEMFSEVTRKRQASLILTAAITSLVSFAVITPVEGTFVNVKFLFASVDIFPFLSGSICLYYLIIYIASLTRDQQHAEYRRLPLEIQMILLENKIEIMSLKTQERIGELQRELIEMMEVKGELTEDQKNKRQQLSSEIKTITEYIPSVFEKSKFLYQSRRKFGSFTTVSEVVEIIFPIVLSFIAICSAIWATFFQ